MLIDSHAHLRPTREALADLLRSMDRLKIDQTVVVGGGLLPPSQIGANISEARGAQSDLNSKITFNNAELLNISRLAEGRILPFYFANPWIAPDEYREIGASFFGLKLGPVIHGCPLEAEEIKTYLHVACMHHHPVYLHCLGRDGFRVKNLIALAEIFPRLTFILGHGGIGNLDFSAIDEIEPHRNILYETSGAFKAVVKAACTKLGMRRVLFGSEYPLQSSIAELAKINDLDLSDENLRAVLGGNISRVLEGSKR